MTQKLKCNENQKWYESFFYGPVRSVVAPGQPKIAVVQSDARMFL